MNSMIFIYRFNILHVLIAQFKIEYLKYLKIKNKADFFNIRK